MRIAVAREVEAAESRVAATPETVKKMTGLGAEVAVVYQRGWNRDLDLGEALEASLARDLATGYTQVGPHRADMSLRLDDATVRDAASRGQQKLVVATLVLAQIRVATAELGPRGTLLVDDPAAELDRGSVERLLEELWALDIQRVLTGLSREALEPLHGFSAFHVERGRIKAML